MDEMIYASYFIRHFQAREMIWLIRYVTPPDDIFIDCFYATSSDMASSRRVEEKINIYEALSLFFSIFSPRADNTRFP